MATIRLFGLKMDKVSEKRCGISVGIDDFRILQHKIERIFSSIPNRTQPGREKTKKCLIIFVYLNDICEYLGLTFEQFIDFVSSHHHEIDREDQNRETFLILDRTCKIFFINKYIDDEHSNDL